MKKKVLLMAAALLAGALTINAQEESESFFKSLRWTVRAGLAINNPSGSMVGAMTDHYVDEFTDERTSVGPTVGYDLECAVTRDFKKVPGLYYGIAVGFGTRGASQKYKYKFQDQNTELREEGKAWVTLFNFKFTPAMVGYKFNIKDDFSLDAHTGFFLSTDFAGAGGTNVKCYYDGVLDEEYKNDEDPWKYLRREYNLNTFDFGMHFGVGVWWKNFNFDFTYQQGFLPAVTTRDIDGYEGTKKVSVFSSNVMIRLGYAF